MSIQNYFAHTKTVIERYSHTAFVFEVKANYELRPGEQGFVHGTILFADGSNLSFKEYLDAAGGAVQKLMYSYHYQDTETRLLLGMIMRDIGQLCHFLSISRPALKLSQHQRLGLQKYWPKW